jgi:signal transduction histidine kinase
LSQDYDITQSGRQIGVVNIRFYGPYFLSDTDFQFLDSLNLLLVSTGLVCLLLSILAGAWLARRISRPIAKTAVIAQEISAGNYAIQFEGKTKTRELQNLVSSINDLANALSMQEALRNRLTADVAHELRTPLATLGTHLEAMIEGIWAPTPERLTSCHEEILRLGKLVSDLERIEKVESDNLNLDRAPTDLLQLARTVCGSFESELANKNLRLDIDGEACVISIDKDRISGVISNLMSNAVKYTPENGQISVLVQSSEHTSILIVEDTGIGIPESELPFIFERFYRADKSRNRGTGGAGLGLAIVKSIVTAHGGAVSAQSVLGHGSRIIITLPKNAR